MFSTAEKTNHAATVVRQKNQQQTFFRKAEDETFFGNSEKSSFFSTPVQAKLSVSSPDDPQEKEADAVAETVMRMPDPKTQTVSESNEEKINRQEEEEEELQTKTEATIYDNINRQEAEEEEEIQAKTDVSSISKINRQASEEEEEVQTKQMSSVFRKSDESFDQFADSFPVEGITEPVSRKKSDKNNSFIVYRNGRGPPRNSGSFEQTLQTSKGLGSALPGNTREFMESRFNADFSGVRVHTGSEAQTMSSNIHAHAFAHANDIYFNEGKYSPHTESGGLLLAHELTHTIQQGASPAKNTVKTAPKFIARKNRIHRSSSGVPVQLTNAVEKAKTVEGKIDANKPQADGYRTGWKHLLEIFKTTFGDDKIIKGGGGTAVQGTVAEQDIKKKREQHGVMVLDKTTLTDKNAIAKTKTGSRDAMPSWCGIFVFWALNKSGVPMPKWKLGENMIKPDAARYPGSPPLPGDIAYRNAYSHFAIVESVSGNTVTTVNGNTAGEDNTGGQVEIRDEPLSDWTAFFNPLEIMKGSLGSSDGPVDEKPKTLKDLRKELFNVDRKEDKENTSETAVQTKPELSSWFVDAKGGLNTRGTEHVQSKTEPDELQKKEEETQEEEKTIAPKLFDHSKINGSGNEVEKDGPQYDMRSHSSPDPVQNNTIQKLSTESSASASKPLALSVEANSRGPPVRLHNYGNIIQGGWFDDAISFVDSAIDYVSEGLEAGKRMLLNEARDFVMAIPGYKALRVVLGEDPITGEEIARNGHNFIEAAFDIMPGGNLLYDKLNELGALTEAEQWIDNGIGAVESLVSGVVGRVERFWNGLSIDDLASPSDIFEEAGDIIHSTISNVIDFAERAATELLEIVKRWLLTQLVDFIKEHTTAYPLLTVIIGEDPITHDPVDRNGTNILNAMLELGGEEGAQQRTQMEETGTFQKVADWIDRGIGVFGNLLETITSNFELIWSVVSIEALMNPVDKFNEIYNVFAQPITDVLLFVAETVKVILKFIKEVLLQRLSEWARGVPGYHLLTVIIEKDPFTNARVERNVENLIHGFMSLMPGGEEQFQQMKESGAIERAAQRIETAVNKLNMTPASIIQLFIDLWNSFSFNDFVQPIVAFERIIATFGEPIGRLIAFIVEIVKIVVVILLEMMNFPFDLISNIINKTISAFQSIKRDPIGFLKNILRAVKQGFVQFFNNIVTYLINGVVGWLMSELRDAGIPELTDFSLKGVMSWVLEVLGISMDKIWEKLAAHPKIGPERVAKIRGMIDTLEGIWTFIKDVYERGIVAIWERIKEQLSNLWNVVLDAVKNWVMTKIIEQVTVKLLSLLDPTGIMAVINSCIAIYKAVQSFVRYMREMLEILNSFVNGIADIAAGNIATAANYLENTMARAMPVVIGFLANQVGLGDVGRRIGDMIESAREMIDNALTWLVNKAVDYGTAFLERAMALGRSAASAVLGWLGIKKEFTADDGKKHTVYFQGTGENAVLYVQSDPTPYTNFLNNYKNELGSAVSDEVTVKGAKKTKGQVIEDAKVVAGDIETEKKKKIASYPGADDKEKEGKKAAEIEKLINNLAELSKPLFGEAQDKPKDNEILIPAGANNNSFATMQEVKMIWKTPKVTGNGSGPDTNAKHTIYDKINFRKKGDGSYYVRGHLINDNIGGPGKWNNMTALSRTANHEHEEKVESKVKAAFDAGAVIRYKVQVSGNQNVKKATTADKDKFTRIEKKEFATALPYLEKITEAESKVPTTLACEAYTMKKNGDTWQDDKNIVTDTVTFDVGGYDEYELGDLGGTVTWDLKKLKEEAEKVDLTFIQFRNKDKIHEESIDLLTEAEHTELEQLFAEKERENAKKEELGKIETMETSEHITTWNAFKSTRVFFSINTDAAYTEVETAFNTKQNDLRNTAINAAKDKADKAAENAFKGKLWSKFKEDEKINFVANAAEKVKITEIEKTFRSKQ